MEKRPYPRRDSQVRLAMLCSTCKAEVLPITSAESLTFYCHNGHERTVDQLLETPSDIVDADLETLLHAWRKNVLALELISQKARLKGHHHAVAVFQRHIANLEARITFLRKAVGNRASC